MRYTFRCQIRWDDMDAFGHVNNVPFVAYMQEARTGMLFAGDAQEYAPDLIKGVVVARHEIDYRRPLTWRPEPIEIDVWTAQVRASSFTLRYEMRDQLAKPEPVVLAEALTVLVPYDLSSGRPRRVTPAERAFLERYLEPENS
ncbi:MAG: acyl-CoA thioesterase [Acidothermus cellulolyticus]|jgi:acyl-CoA thioester hydrolase|nr:thioesterase family protein [Acidothermus cellulolyticus]MBX5447346.1 acyl-CoA thioesterase [Acidothermus cellulolyticus]MCL6549392.1 acyl-CoA thioesterase [Acidothermus cellulolyticus]